MSLFAIRHPSNDCGWRMHPLLHSTVPAILAVELSLEFCQPFMPLGSLSACLQRINSDHTVFSQRKVLDRIRVPSLRGATGLLSCGIIVEF